MAKKPRRIMKEFRLDEISAVDTPAQGPARMSIMKRADPPEPVAVRIAKYCVERSAEAGAQDFQTLLGQNEQRRKYWEAHEEIYPALEALGDSVRSIVSDMWLTASAKEAMIRAGLDDFIAAVKDKLPEVEEELTKLFTETGDQPANVGKKETLMPDAKEQVAALEKSVTDLKDQLAKANAAAEAAQVVAKMSDAEKAYMDKMSDEDKKKFMAMTADDRKAKMEAAKRADETVIIDGVEVRKSETPAATFDLLKKQAGEIAKAKDEAETAKFTKRAQDELGHLPGTDEEKAYVLKAVASLDETATDRLSKMLKASDEALAKQMGEVGKSGAGAQSDASGSAVEKEVAIKAASIAERDKISIEKAKAKAWVENPDLAKRYYDEKEAK